MKRDFLSFFLVFYHFPLILYHFFRLIFLCYSPLSSVFHFHISLCCYPNSSSPSTHCHPHFLSVQLLKSLSLKSIQLIATEIESRVWNRKRERERENRKMPLPPYLSLSLCLSQWQIFHLLYCSKPCLSLDPGFSLLWHDRMKGERQRH